jgi:anaerobic selenocysteine-containing dehydrogenase
VSIGQTNLPALSRPDLTPPGTRSVNMIQLGRVLTDQSMDPPIKSLYVWNSNPAVIAADQRRVLEGLARPDLFTVVHEQFMTDTARHADVVLPATTQLEHLDVVFSWGHHYLTWNEPAVEPLGEAKPNTEIFRLLAARLGLDDPCFTDSDEELVDQLLAGARDGVALDGLRERGWVKLDLGQGPAPHAQGGFGTQSGAMKLSAEYEPPLEVADEALGARFPLALITPKTHLFLNSSFANQTRQHSAQPHPEVVVHPDDAGSRGIADGTDVRVFNERGDFRCVARVSDDATPGVLVAPMGWWNADYADGRAAQATTGQALTKAGNAPIFNDNRVELESA